MTEPAAQPHDSPARRWTRQWGVTRSNRLTELTAVAIFAILCALLWLPNWREERVNSLRERRDRYGDISQHGRNIAYAVLEMRAAVRGYLLSGRPEFRAEYVEAGNRVQSASDELEALITTQDDPALADAHAAYAVALTSWRSGHLEYLVAMVDRGDTAEAQAYFVGGHGQQQVTEAQTQLAAIQSLAHDYERTIRTEITSLSAFVVLLNNGLLGLALIAMALVVVGYAQQRRTNAALRRADSVNQRLSQQLEAELSAAEQRNTLLDAGQQLLNQLPVFQQADDALEQLAWTVLRVYDLTAVAIWIDSTARGGYVAQHVIAQSSFSAGLPPPARLSVQSGKMTSVERGAGQLWYVPIEWDGVVVGVCALGGDPARIDVEHIRQQVLLSIENVVLFQQLRRNEARLHAVFSHAPLGFVLTDRTGMVLLANQRAQAVLPWVAAGEDACRPDAHGSFFAQGGAPIATSALPLAKAVASCDAQRAEIFHEQDGVRIPIRHEVVIVAETGFLWVLEDMRQLYELERMKGMFISMIRHELRAPLVTILGVTAMALRGGGTPERQLAQYEVIERQALTLQSLIDTLLHLSDIERDGLLLQCESADLQLLVQRVILRGSGWKLRCRVTVLQNADVWVDVGRYEQVLVEVISNALQYGGDGTVEVIIGPIQPADQTMLVTVRDGGVPLSDQEYGRVFEQFYQAHGHHSSGGIGLGLAMCRVVVEAHGGTITMSATPQHDGTQVVMTIPLAVTHAGTGVGALVGAYQTLLIHAADERSRLLVAAITEHQGMVDHVVSLREAYARLERQQYDLVVIEAQLDDGEGIAAVRHIRSWQSTPIILVAGRLVERALHEALRAGVDEYLVEPIQTTEFSLRVANLLRRSAGAVPAAAQIRVGNVVAHLNQKQLEVAGVVVDVTPTEYRLFVACARQLGQILTHERLLAAVWGDRYDQETQYLWVHMSHLRRKLQTSGAVGLVIETIRSVGYRMQLTNT